MIAKGHGDSASDELFVYDHAANSTILPGSP